MSITQELYRAVAVEDHDGRWELHRGKLREKPSMSFAHNEVMVELGYQLRAQLPPEQFIVRINSGRLSLGEDSYYIPDVLVMRRPTGATAATHAPALETYSQPALLVAEVWSPSTGEYDVEGKLPRYRERGDLEIWRIHPVARSIDIWTRRANGEYELQSANWGVLTPSAFPGVRIDVGLLFAHV
jgi:Uma2 family endonuclease